MLLLASASPARRRLLEQAAIPHRVQVSGVDDIDVGGQPAGRGAAQHHLRTLRKRYTQLTRAASGPSKAINLIEKALGPVALKKTCWFWLKMEAEVQQKRD